MSVNDKASFTMRAERHTGLDASPSINGASDLVMRWT